MSRPPAERMNSPLERRKVRLRGLGGPAVCGAPRPGASAAGARCRRLLPGRLKPRLQRHEVRLRGLGGPAVCGVPRSGASVAGVRCRRLLPGRLKPRLRRHEVRLRGLGGPAACGAPRPGASATGREGRLPRGVILRERTPATIVTAEACARPKDLYRVAKDSAFGSRSSRSAVPGTRRESSTGARRTKILRSAHRLLCVPGGSGGRLSQDDTGGAPVASGFVGRGDG